MAYFPICVDLKGKRVLLVGSGPQIQDKMEKLRPFGAELISHSALKPEDLTEDVAFVVAGDLDEDALVEISRLCRSRRIPVNVVDDPSKSTFFFPALTVRGDLTVSVSTGGKVPGAAACISARIRENLPDDAGEILDSLQALREKLYSVYPKDEARRMLLEAVRKTFQ